MVKKFALMAIAALACAAPAIAQESIETTVAADVVNQYIWRGQNLGNAALQPTLGIGSDWCDYLGDYVLQCIFHR